MRDRIHSAAKLLPPMTDEEYRGLVADIKRTGQREPIVLFKGRVLDGVHRLRACRELGLTPERITRDDIADPVAYVLSRNLQRRHLTPSQRAMLAVKTLPALQREAKARQRVGGRLKGSAHLRQAGKATAHAARAVGVSARYVEEAKALHAAAPALARRVERGELSLNEAQATVSRQLPSMSAAQRRQLIQQGDTVAGRLRTFANRTIRQITLAYGSKEHRDVVGRLERVIEETRTKNPSEALLWLLDYWERGHG